MAERYDGIGDGDCSYSCLDELLCEYVDGTMDPAVRRAFEEYLRTDPVLARQVERLRCTRRLLCRHGCHRSSTRGVRARMRRRLASEMMHASPSLFPEATSQLGSFVAVGSVMAALMMAGLLVGAALLTEKDTAITDRAVVPPRVVWQGEGWQPAVGTPWGGQPLYGTPAFVRQSVPFRLAQPYHRLPEVFPEERLQTAVLQRTGVAP